MSKTDTWAYGHLVPHALLKQIAFALDNPQGLAASESRSRLHGILSRPVSRRVPVEAPKRKKPVRSRKDIQAIRELQDVLDGARQTLSRLATAGVSGVSGTQLRQIENVLQCWEPTPKKKGKR